MRAPRAPEGDEQLLGRKRRELETAERAPLVGQPDPRAIQARLGSGRPLDAAVRSQVERSFGEDLSRVRVHTDGRAGALAQQMDARAFTVGQDVAFAPGDYRPGTARGNLLIAHELAHVAQQRRGRSEGAGGVRDDRHLEQSADAAAQGAFGLAGPSPVRGRAGLRLQRCPRDDEPRSSTRERRSTPEPARPAPRPSAPTGRALPSPDPSSWQGMHFDAEDREEAIAELARRSQVSREEAERVVDRQLERVRLYPRAWGIPDDRYSYDIFQDVVIGQDGQMPNCFGDVCQGGRRRWEPTDRELAEWLSSNGYVPDDDCSCREGVQTVAVYTARLGGAAQPIHIAELQPDCRWRSRMGDLGVLYHERPDQIWPESAVQQLVGDSRATRDIRCYSRRRRE